MDIYEILFWANNESGLTLERKISRSKWKTVSGMLEIHSKNPRWCGIALYDNSDKSQGEQPVLLESHGIIGEYSGCPTFVPEEA